MAATGNSGTERERVGAFDHLIDRRDRVRLGEAIRSSRERAGVSQGELAKRLGISQAVLSKIELAHREVTVLELVAICDALALPVADVISAAVPPERS